VLVRRPMKRCSDERPAQNFRKKIVQLIVMSHPTSTMPPLLSLTFKHLVELSLDTCPTKDYQFLIFSNSVDVIVFKRYSSFIRNVQNHNSGGKGKNIQNIQPFEYTTQLQHTSKPLRCILLAFHPSDHGHYIICNTPSYTLDTVCEYYRLNNVMTFKTTWFIVAKHIIAFQNQSIFSLFFFLKSTMFFFEKRLWYFSKSKILSILLHPNRP
jgi:hypothetical protein